MQKLPPQDQASIAQSSATNRRPAPTPHGLLPLSAGLGVRIDALEQQAKEALSLLARVRSVLAEPEKNHVLSAVYRRETLVIMLDSAAWGARLRFQEKVLRERLVALGEKPFTNLKVRVGRA